MCGIFGYVGDKPAKNLLLDGLEKLEYRGYDSVGITLINDDLIDPIKTYKCKGGVSDLKNVLLKKRDIIKATTGIGHTRWATHGEPNEINAHPHTSFHGNFTVVHNGIIENYVSLKKFLTSKGVKFKSETDTEIIASLIEYFAMSEGLSAELAIGKALTKLIGTYGLVVLCKHEPEKLFAVRKSSPLVLGLGDNENFVASDTFPIIKYTSKIIFLNDNDFAIITKDECVIKSKSKIIDPVITEVTTTENEISKEGFEHFMLKEIFEQPKAIHDTFRGRIHNYEINLGGLFNVRQTFYDAKRIIIVACGTSWHAGLMGEYIFEEYARIPVEVEYASEFRYRNPIFKSGDIVLAISQSGETADTLAAVELAKEAKIPVFGICNVVGTTLSRVTDAGVYTHAGPEIGVASTKAFTTQVTILAMMAIKLAEEKGQLTHDMIVQLHDELLMIPEKIQKTLELNDKILDVAKTFNGTTNALYLGRGYLFPTALEGALKLKEISYIHAEGYPAAEMKHGPIALIDENMPSIVLALKDKTYDKIISNIQEIKARKGKVIAVVTEGDEAIKQMVDFTLEIPETLPLFSGILSVIPLQLLSYHIAKLKGCNIDKPRNLAKSVTVE